MTFSIFRGIVSNIFQNLYKHANIFLRSFAIFWGVICAEVHKACRSQNMLQNEPFSCKNRLRWSRERASERYIHPHPLIKNFQDFQKIKRETTQTHLKAGASVLNAGRAGSSPHESWPHSSLPKARCWLSFFATTNNNICGVLKVQLKS